MQVQLWPLTHCVFVWNSDKWSFPVSVVCVHWRVVLASVSAWHRANTKPERKGQSRIAQHPRKCGLKLTLFCWGIAEALEKPSGVPADSHFCAIARVCAQVRPYVRVFLWLPERAILSGSFSYRVNRYTSRVITARSQLNLPTRARALWSFPYMRKLRLATYAW